MKIFLDPGHGGNDPGAIGVKGTKESEVVLAAALDLKDILQAEGFEVALSRTADTTMSLASRAELANRYGGDLFVSIHCNGFTNSGASGTEVFAYPGDADGGELAEKILTKICASLGTKNRGVKTENFAVLRLTEMTAVLIETAFITNAAEEQMMLGKGYSKKLAQAIADGIFAFVGKNSVGEEHWGREYLDRLIKKGYINSPELWTDFDGHPTNAMVLALVDKITEEKQNDNT